MTAQMSQESPMPTWTCHFDPSRQLWVCAPRVYPGREHLVLLYITEMERLYAQQSPARERSRLLAWRMDLAAAGVAATDNVQFVFKHECDTGGS